MSTTATARPDPRSQRTRQLLQQALLDLIEERGFGSLTIRDLTEHAGINRVTFYLHYHDKFDLLAQTIDEVRATLEAQDKPLIGTNYLHTDQLPPTLFALLQHVAEHANFYRIMLGKGALPEMTVHIRQHIEDFLTARLQTWATAVTPPQIPMVVLTRYTASAYLGVLAWWLEQKPLPPPEQVANWIWQLTRQGFVPFVEPRASVVGDSRQ